MAHKDLPPGFGSLAGTTGRKIGALPINCTRTPIRAARWPFVLPLLGIERVVEIFRRGRVQLIVEQHVFQLLATVFLVFLLVARNIPELIETPGDMRLACACPRRIVELSANGHRTGTVICTGLNENRQHHCKPLIYMVPGAGVEPA